MSYRKQTLTFFKFSLCLINLIRHAGVTPFFHCVQRLIYSAMFASSCDGKKGRRLLWWNPHPQLTENSLHNRLTRTGEFSNPCRLSTAAYSMSKSCTPVEHSSREKDWQKRVAELQIQLWDPHTREVATEKNHLHAPEALNSGAQWGTTHDTDMVGPSRAGLCGHH